MLRRVRCVQIFLKNKVYICNTIKAKGLGQRFEERRRGRPADRCLQHNSEKTKHRCSPESRRSIEGRRSHKEMRSR